MSESVNAETQPALVSPTLRVKNPELLARLVVRENKPFNTSALACGYSQSIADKGLINLVHVSSAVSTAVKREQDRLTTSLDTLKPLAIRRLHDEIVNPKSSLGMKAIELAGRFKETDWFVRNAEVNVGVFAALGELGPSIDVAASVVPEEE